MEYTLEKQGNENTFFKDFGNWSRLEDYFKKQLSEKELQSRRFRNMKLREYNRLLRIYSGTQLSRDERSLMTVMKFQRGSLVRSLYPGLLSRMYYLVSKGLEDMFFHSKELERAKMANDERIINTQIRLPEQPLNPSESLDQSKEADLDNKGQLHHRIYGPDLGQKMKKDEQQQFKGPSI